MGSNVMLVRMNLHATLIQIPNAILPPSFFLKIPTLTQLRPAQAQAQHLDLDRGQAVDQVQNQSQGPDRDEEEEVVAKILTEADIIVSKIKARAEEIRVEV